MDINEHERGYPILHLPEDKN